jgi:hypothetical protein
MRNPSWWDSFPRQWPFGPIDLYWRITCPVSRSRRLLGTTRWLPVTALLFSCSCVRHCSSTRTSYWTFVHIVLGTPEAPPGLHFGSPLRNLSLCSKSLLVRATRTFLLLDHLMHMPLQPLGSSKSKLRMIWSPETRQGTPGIPVPNSRSACPCLIHLDSRLVVSILLQTQLWKKCRLLSFNEKANSGLQGKVVENGRHCAS